MRSYFRVCPRFRKEALRCVRRVVLETRSLTVPYCRVLHSVSNKKLLDVILFEELDCLMKPWMPVGVWGAWREGEGGGRFGVFGAIKDGFYPKEKEKYRNTASPCPHLALSKLWLYCSKVGHSIAPNPLDN